MFNVIKGEFIKKETEPKILNYNKNSSEESVVLQKSEEKEKSEKEILEEELNSKRKELEMINAEIIRKKVSRDLSRGEQA